MDAMGSTDVWHIKTPRAMLTGSESTALKGINLEQEATDILNSKAVFISISQEWQLLAFDSRPWISLSLWYIKPEEVTGNHCTVFSEDFRNEIITLFQAQGQPINISGPK